MLLSAGMVRRRTRLRRSIAGLEDVAAENPGDWAVRNNVLSAYDRLGRTLLATWRLPKAAEAYRRELDLPVKAVSDFPARPDVRNRPAVARGNLALAQAAAGRRAKRNGPRMSVDRPASTASSKDGRGRFLGGPQTNLGNLCIEAGRVSEAEPRYPAGGDRVRAAQPGVPGEPGLPRALGLHPEQPGSGPEQTQPILGGVRPVLIQAEALMDRLAADFPDLPDGPSELAGIQINLGIVLKNLGEGPEAEKFYRKAIVVLGARSHDFRLYRSIAAGWARPRRISATSFGGRAASRTPQGQARGGDDIRTIGRRFSQAAGAPELSGDRSVRPRYYPRPIRPIRRRGRGVHPGARAAGDVVGRRARKSSLRPGIGLDLQQPGRVARLGTGPPYCGADRAVELGKKAVKLQPQTGSRWRTLGWADPTWALAGVRLGDGARAASWIPGRRDYFFRRWTLAVG